MNFFSHPRAIVGFFLFLGALSIWSASKLTFRFDFEQFFPSGDPELEFFLDFREKFEGDDNFLLIGLPAEGRFFDSTYLYQLDSLTRNCRKLPYVELVSSPTAFRYAVKSPFGLLDYPAIHLDEPERWAADSLRLAGDERISGRLFTKDFKASVIALKTLDKIDQAQSDELIGELNQYLDQSGFEEYHLLGRANFQSVLVAQQKKEFAFSTIASALLVFIIFIVLFRKPLGVIIGLFSVLLSMILFLGVLGAMGRPLDFMAMLYTVLMIIIAVSDVVHIMTKYQLELRKGKSAGEAIRNTRREIGLATFLTSATTAIGFITLITYRVPPVKSFGYSAAIGVMVAYLTVILFTTALLSLVPPEKVCDLKSKDRIWTGWLESLYLWGLRKNKWIGPGLAVTLIIAIAGMAKITTDVRIYDGLPRGYKITQDFRFFEDKLAGFRPLDIAAIAAPGHRADEPAVLVEIDKYEQFMAQFPELGSPQSLVTLYKSIHRASNGDRASAYVLPDDEKTLRQYKRLVDRLPDQSSRALLSEDGRYARISSTILDVGTDSVGLISDALNEFARTQTDSTLVTFRQTGTGILFDKNNEYLRASLISGLSIAFVVIGLIMGGLFRNWKMVFISIIPNVVPLVVGAAFLGILGIPLDASTAIIFAISFGIAVDDTIHFLSKFKWELSRGIPVETALNRCYVETGKAIFLTSVILFFGFCILLFSSTPGTNYVGLMISITLFSALFSDLLLIPWLVRWLLVKEVGQVEIAAQTNPVPVH